MSLSAAIEAFDLDAYLDAYGADAISDIERLLPCPNCGKPKLTINLEKKAWHCWVCEAETGRGRGGLVDLFMLLEGITRSQAGGRLLDSYDGAMTLQEVGGLIEQAQEDPHEVREIMPPPHWRWVSDVGILPYCVDRGITPQDATDFRLMVCDQGRFAARLVFPVFEMGRLVYYQARAMWPESSQPPGTRYVKTLNPKRLRGAAGSGDVLFNIDQASTHPRVAITEGPVDAVHVGTSAVCTFGKKISPVQVGKMIRYGVRAVDLLWDGPSLTEPHGAWPEMFRAGEVLARYFDTRLVFLPKGDPGDYPRDHLDWYRQNSYRAVRSPQKNIMEI